MDFKERKKAAQTIAKELKEKNYLLIIRIIEVAGIDFAHKLLDQTRQVQADGGMLTHDKSRKRTLGGVYFYLARTNLTPEHHDKLFPKKDWKNLQEKKKQKKQQAQATTTQPTQSAPQKEAPQIKVLPPVAPKVNTEPLSAKDHKLAQLQEASQTLRERITQMEAKGQKGVKMTQRLLENTETQIEKLTSA
ncbi:MAG: phosphorylated adapter RNA export RNA-binding domain-containing protein [Phototrophicaceae bacterium]